MTATTREDFVSLHLRDEAEKERLREQLAAANGRAARAEHKVIALTEECAKLRAQVPGQRRTR